MTCDSVSLYLCIGLIAVAMFGALVWSRVKTAQWGIAPDRRYQPDGSAGGGFHGGSTFGGDCGDGGGGSDCGTG